MTKLIFFIKFFGSLIHYKGIERLTFWEWAYKRRLGFDTVNELWKLKMGKPLKNEAR